jgi:hypothetical protein
MHNSSLIAKDQSPGAVLKRVRLQLPNEADTLLHGRVRVVKYVTFLGLADSVLTME